MSSEQIQNTDPFNNECNIATLANESMVIDIPLIKQCDQETNGTVDQQSQSEMADTEIYSFSCNVLPDKVEEKEEEVIKDAFQNTIKLYNKNAQKVQVNQIIDKSPVNSPSTRLNRNSIVQQQHPLMNFQKIRSIIVDIQKEQIENNGVSSKENYGRDCNLEWKAQILQHPAETKYLRVATLTWNLHGSCPKDNLNDILWFLNKATHHIVVIATQECERSIAASFFYSSKSKWEQAVLNNMSDNYVKVHSLKMNALHLIVLSHKTLRPYIKNIQSDRRATGIGNYLGNKGGLGISFDVGKRSYLFVNMHLSSGKENADRRNKDFINIEHNLNLGKNLTNNRSNQERVSNRFDYAFFLGDMNYRVNTDIQQKDVNEHNYIQLLLHDQLLQEIELLASDFSEGMITFPPTYKLDAVQNRFYVGKKKRQPAWTDRVLFKSQYQNSLFQMTYDCNSNIFGSDHRPVYSQFLVQNLLTSADDQFVNYS